MEMFLANRLAVNATSTKIPSKIFDFIVI